MKESEKYFIVRKKAVPEVLLKVVEAKRLLDSEKAITIQDATESVGISRSSFYKYKDDIFPFHDNARGKTFTFMLQMDDEPGLLSGVLNKIANNGANILTINQTIPVNSIALLTISIEILPSAVDVTAMIDDIEALKGIHSLKILARE
jgi:ACT domain-containing protein